MKESSIEMVATARSGRTNALERLESRKRSGHATKRPSRAVAPAILLRILSDLPFRALNAGRRKAVSHGATLH